MSRPVTRYKNKRNRPEDDNGSTSQVLRKIHLTGNVTSDDIRQLYMISKPICQGCRVNSKDNPNCFCGLVPPLNGSRKSGLWQKISDIILSFGPDPSVDLRDSTSWPAGLTNLGATCYANSILQCLYMNTSFRAGVFSVEPDLLAKHPVLDQLARLFSQLHSSRRAFIDSAPFIKTLELDNGVQQDSHEFFTLLLSLLQRSLRYSKVSKARTIVQDLFRGNVSHVTRCSKCGKESAASSKMEDFYELELNIKGLKNLYESLEDYLSIEELSGDNQYFCESCGERVDATRCIKLRTLPDILNFQLKRCVFVPKTTTKKKLTSVFTFPGELDMGQKVCEPSEMELIYDLSAVLIHKGTTVNSGHYVANIKDEHTRQWWEFDDEHVSQLGAHPFGEVSSSSSPKHTENEADLQPSTSKKIDSISNGNHNISQLQPSDSKILCEAESFSSADAYMLMYRRRSTRKYIHQLSADLERHQSVVSDDIGNCLPFHLSEEIKELNASYIKASQDYKLKKDREIENITQRRQEVRSILSEAPVPSLEEQYFWITTEWLRQWADNVIPPTLDNSSIQCLHGRIPVSKVGLMKRLSAKAWTMLLSKYGGGPALANDDICIDCLIDGAKVTVRADDYRDRRAALKEDAEAALAGKFQDGTLYYVSRAWLLQWTRRKNVDFPCEADIGPTASIRCPHGELLPEQAAGAKRVLVPENLWLFLWESSNAVNPDDPLGCSTFPLDTEPCALCSVELSEVACLEDNLRAAKLKQRQNHDKLFQGKNIPLSPGSKYYLLPSLWVTKWRSYITSGRNVSSSVEPDSLDSVIDSLICDKHSRLLERPPILIWKRGLIQMTSPTSGLIIITEKDWKFFCEEWGGTERKGISAQIELSGCRTNELVGSCEEVPIPVERLSPSNDGSNDELELRQPLLTTHPEICEDCIGERESCELMQKLNYCNAEIVVVLVRGKDVPRWVLEAQGTSSEPDRRSSKRSRKASCGNSINLKVSGSTSIYQLKMLIWESFGVVKENQILHKGSRVIEEESITLADVNIFPGDILWVRDSEIHEHRDIADELSEQKMEIQPAERGFRGTLLTSNISAQ